MMRRKSWRTTEAIQQARELHQRQTPAEQKLWTCLRRKQLYGLKFRRQHPIGPFIAAFCCVAHRLVVEVDGPSHASQEEYDQARTAWLEERGYKVIRFTNQQVHRHLNAVLAEIARQCAISVQSSVG